MLTARHAAESASLQLMLALMRSCCTHPLLFLSAGCSSDGHGAQYFSTQAFRAEALSASEPCGLAAAAAASVSAAVARDRRLRDKFNMFVCLGVFTRALQPHALLLLACILQSNDTASVKIFKTWIANYLRMHIGGIATWCLKVAEEPASGVNVVQETDRSGL
jgi:hypothetical protein